MINSKYWDKATLYYHIKQLRHQLNITLYDYPLNTIELAMQHCRDPLIQQLPFSSVAICGILSKGKDTTSIALNALRSKQMQNFDCGHELIHYFFHESGLYQCICTDKDSKIRSINQDPFMEWQANEGSAELLVPYKMFIPDYIRLSREHARNPLKAVPLDILAHKYNVTETVIRNRISSLNFEIYQYLNGVKVENIILLSANKLKQLHWHEQHQKRYCQNCLAPISLKQNFCPICGKPMFYNGLKKFNSIIKGAGYMKYSGIQLNPTTMRAVLCPNCKNEDIDKTHNFCMVCGCNIINQCTNFDCEFEGALPGNARYCPYCGSHSSFYNSGVLQDWNISNVKKETPAESFSDLLDEDRVIYIDNPDQVPF